MRYMLVGLALVGLLSCSGGSGTIEMDVDSGAFVDVSEAADLVQDDGVSVDVTEIDFILLDYRADSDLLEEINDAHSELACAPGGGCFMDQCTQNEQCLSGWCVEHMGEGVCTQTCEAECPVGWSCKQVAGTEPDVVFICVSGFANLCKPCGGNEQCQSPGGATDVCVSYAGSGWFCGGICDSESDCPPGFECLETDTWDGTTAMQCVAESGTCECTDKSVSMSLATPCSQENDWGICSGKRVCTQDGLTECDASVAVGETCNGLDDDCDGDLDEPDLVEGDYVNLCDDGNECTDDNCLGVDGCELVMLDGTDCGDGDACTIGDHCEDGSCVALPVMCDDENECTDDTCGPDGECVFDFNIEDCDDGDPCTVADECTGGECKGYAVACDCQVDEDCQVLEDNDLCNGTLYCDVSKLPYQCAVILESLVECASPNGVDAPCLDVVCDEDNGECSFVAANEGYACDDGDACTVGEHCENGSCGAASTANCADDNPCTDDSCDPLDGCQHVNNELPCSDGNACTAGDYCKESLCNGGPAPVCDDNNICTADDCESALGCTHTPVAGSCDDGNACTEGDFCAGGACMPGTGLDCDDGNLCTDDSCDVAGGCGHVANANPCSDGDVCTGPDVCKEGMCLPGDLTECDDGNICTDDSCNSDDGCLFVANNLACDDNNLCTDGDQCQSGLCYPGESVDCDDSNICTTDTCTPADGCVHSHNQVPCDDGDACTIGDVCNLAACVAGLVPANCNDGNVCTDDVCEPASGCVHNHNETACDDGSACTLSDTCKDGQCLPGQAPDCEDQNICTDDSCEPATGCVHIPNQSACTDDNACTVDDSCLGSVCAPGPAPDCDDLNPCTNDSCDMVQGCIYSNVLDTSPCESDGICAGLCAVGVCVESAVEICDGEDNTCNDVIDEGFTDTNNDGEADCVDDDDDGDLALDDDDCEPLDDTIHPGADEICGNNIDDDCDPDTGDLCALASCKAILDAGLSEGTGTYWIDPDEELIEEPFQVHCDMTLDGGGWTRFNWLLQVYPAGQDPLGQNLSECSLDATICRGRIPSSAEPTHLLVKDVTQGEHAAWQFNNGTISNAVLHALRDKQEHCSAQQGAFQPYISTSSEGYCGSGQEGGCDSFYYTSGACMGAGNWGIHWDGDNHWCAAAFKMGATISGGCGTNDQGFLNDCDCDDEHGELYYR